ncbi:hypothetical protein CMK17_21555 [Candidatus Poribacteria bacterium]|nr:hypothetical protein [Candidatus Poribacteria bacterium]
MGVIRDKGTGGDVEEFGIGVEAGGDEGRPVDGIPGDRNRARNGSAIIENRSIGEGELTDIDPAGHAGNIDALFGVEVHPGVDLEGEILRCVAGPNAFLRPAQSAEGGIAVVEGEAVGRHLGAGSVDDLDIKGGRKAIGGSAQGRDGEAGEAKALTVDGESELAILNAGGLTSHDGAVTKIRGAVGIAVEVLAVAGGRRIVDEGIGAVVDLGRVCYGIAVGIAKEGISPMGVDFLAVAEAVAVGIVAVWVGFTGIDHRISVGILLAVGQTVAVGIIILGIGAQVTLLGVGQSIAVRIAEGPVGTVRGPGRGFPNRSVVVGVKAVGDLIGIRKTIVVAVPGSAGRHDKIVNEEVLVGSTHAGRDDEGEIIMALEGGGTDIGEVGVGVEAGGGEAGPVDRIPFDFNRTGDPLAIVENDTIGEGELPEIQTTHNPGDVDALLSVRIHPGVDLPGDVVLRMSSSHAFLGISLRAEDGITVVEGEAVGRRVGTNTVEELVIKGDLEPRGGAFQRRDGEAGESKALVVDGELQATTLNGGGRPIEDRAITKIRGAVGIAFEILYVGIPDIVSDGGIAPLVDLRSVP